MTDVATKPGAENAAENPDGAPAADASGPAVYEWAPIEPRPRKRHLALWIGVPAGLLLLGAGVASAVLIAPGTAVAGVPVGWLTVGAAADAIQSRVETTTVTLALPGGDVTVTGSDLGATVDAQALADDAFAEHPMWNISSWFADPAPATITLNAETAAAALREVAPALYTDPVDATVAFDAEKSAYVATPAVLGTSVDLPSVQAAIQGAFTTGAPDAALTPVAAPVEALTTDAIAGERTSELNAMLKTAGFYVGDEIAVPLAPATVASWLTLTPDETGQIEVTADPAAIQKTVDTLKKAVDRAVVNGSEVTNSSGTVLSVLRGGVDGRTLRSTAGIAAAFASQLGHGNGVYALPVTVTPAKVVALARSITVDLSEQRVYLYENGAVVASYLISSGRPGYETHTGHFRINAKLASQNMGNPDLTKAPFYYTKNVPDVMYFNGDQALHGAYWHHNFGNVMSHGCVNMPLGAAEFAFSWAPMGTEVTVQQ